MWNTAYSEILGTEESNEVLFIVFVPSKDKDGIDLADHHQWVEGAARMLGHLFGGSTIMPPARGTWLNPETNELIVEEVVLVHSYATRADAEAPAKLEDLGRFLHRMGRETNQGEIGIAVNGVFHRIRRFRLA